MIYDQLVKEFVSSYTREKYKFTFIVVTYNNSDCLIRSLQTTNIPKNVNLIVVDNGSSDEHVEAIERYLLENSDSHVLLRLPENLGGAGGYYIGSKFAYEIESEWIIISEDDCMAVESNILERMVCQLSNPNLIYRATYKENPLESFSFHFSAYHKSVFEDIGFPDPTFFMRSDDMEFELRLRNSQFNIEKLHSCYYSHPIHKEYKSKVMDYFYLRNTMLTCIKHRRFLQYHLCLTHYVLFSFSDMFFNICASRIIILKLALKDLIFSKISYELNKDRLELIRTLPESAVKFRSLEKVPLHDANIMSRSLKIKGSKKKSKNIVVFSYFSHLMFLFYLFPERTYHLKNSTTLEGARIFKQSTYKRSSKLVAFFLIVPVAIIVLNVFMLPVYFSRKFSR